MLPQGLETENSTMIFTEMEKRLAQIASAQKFETAKLLLKKSHLQTDGPGEAMKQRSVM